MCPKDLFGGPFLPYLIGKFSSRRTLDNKNARRSGHRETDGIELKDIKDFFTDIVIFKFLV